MPVGVIASKAEAPCICYYSDIGLPDNWHYMSCTACVIASKAEAPCICYYSDTQAVQDI
jgi:hypothetical protein